AEVMFVLGEAEPAHWAARATGLWLEDRGTHVPRACVRATPRIGVDYAGKIWAAKPWRFVFTPPATPAAPPPARPRPISPPTPRRA
ncbi:MAG: hypothetical protein RLZZ15_87, partial [Verrucomicrobiota bacterium]